MWIGIAGLLGALAVLMGAFGAHGLKNRVEPEALAWWQTAAQYHFYHALALLGVALLMQHAGASRLLTASAVAFTVGTLLFSGSLYAMTISGIRALGAITPLGGLAWIVAWGLLAWYGFVRQPL